MSDYCGESWGGPLDGRIMAAGSPELCYPVRVEQTGESNGYVRAAQWRIAYYDWDVARRRWRFSHIAPLPQRGT